jgi:hypothetical protein
MADKEEQKPAPSSTEQQKQSDTKTGTQPLTSQNFEFTDSSFKRGQGSGNLEKRVIDTSQPPTVKKEQGS